MASASPPPTATPTSANSASASPSTDAQHSHTTTHAHVHPPHRHVPRHNDRRGTTPDECGYREAGTFTRRLHHGHHDAIASLPVTRLRAGSHPRPRRRRPVPQRFRMDGGRIRLRYPARPHRHRHFVGDGKLLIGRSEPRPRWRGSELLPRRIHVEGEEQEQQQRAYRRPAWYCGPGSAGRVSNERVDLLSGLGPTLMLPRIFPAVGVTFSPVSERCRERATAMPSSEPSRDGEVTLVGNMGGGRDNQPV